MPRCASRTCSPRSAWTLPSRARYFSRRASVADAEENSVWILPLSSADATRASSASVQHVARLVVRHAFARPGHSALEERHSSRHSHRRVGLAERRAIGVHGKAVTCHQLHVTDNLELFLVFADLPFPPRHREVATASIPNLYRDADELRRVVLVSELSLGFDDELLLGFTELLKRGAGTFENGPRVEPRRALHR